MQKFLDELQQTAKETLRWGMAKSLGSILVYLNVALWVVPAATAAALPDPTHALYATRGLCLVLLYMSAVAAVQAAQIVIAPRLYLLNEAGDFVLALRKAGLDEDVALRVARVL